MYPFICFIRIIRMQIRNIGQEVYIDECQNMKTQINVKTRK